MPTFSYQPLGGGGNAVIDAPDRAAAVRALRQRGITPVRIEAVGGSVPAAEDAPAAETVPAPAVAPTRAAGAGAGSISAGEMAAFVRELATAIQAGLPLVLALKTIARQGPNPRRAAMLAHLIHEVEHGRSLAEAAASWGRPFGEMVVSLIRAGELSGRLGEVLEQSADLLERELKLRRTLAEGMIYPSFLALLIIGAIGVISTVIVPRILSQFSGQIRAGQLPLPTRVVMATTDFVTTWWWLLLAVAAGVTMFVVNTYRQPAGRLKIDRALLRVPALGAVLRDVAVARFTRVLATLVGAGLPALTSLRITRGALGNKAMERAIEDVCDQVAAGKTIADPMEASGYFPPLLTQIMGVGERSGRLPQMLSQAAGVFEDRTQSSIRVFTQLFPLVMVIVAAVLVAFVVLAVLLPLVQMQEMIG